MDAQASRTLLACAIVAVTGLCVMGAPFSSTSAPMTDSMGQANNSDTCGPKDFFYWEGPDCTKFIKCKYGNITFHTCPGGKFWNHEMAKCDAKKNVTHCSEEGKYLFNQTSASPQAAPNGEVPEAAVRSSSNDDTSSSQTSDKSQERTYGSGYGYGSGLGHHGHHQAPGYGSGYGSGYNNGYGSYGASHSGSYAGSHSGSYGGHHNTGYGGHGGYGPHQVGYGYGHQPGYGQYGHGYRRNHNSYQDTEEAYGEEYQPVQPYLTG